MSENVWNFEQSVNVVEMTPDNYEEIFEKLKNEKYDELEIDKISEKKFLETYWNNEVGKYYSWENILYINLDWNELIQKGRYNSKIRFFTRNLFYKWWQYVEKMEENYYNGINDYFITLNIYNKDSYLLYISNLPKDEELNLSYIFCNFQIRTKWFKKLKIKERWFLASKKTIFFNGINNKENIESNIHIDWCIVESLHIWNAKKVDIKLDKRIEESIKNLYIRDSPDIDIINLQADNIGLLNCFIKLGNFWNIKKFLLEDCKIKELYLWNKIENLTIKDLKLQKDSSILIENWEIDSLEMENVVVEGRIDIVRAKIKDFTLSRFENMWFFNLDNSRITNSLFMSKDCRLWNSNISNIDFSELKWNLKLETEFWEETSFSQVNFWDVSKYNLTRDSARNLKYIYDEKHNFIDGNKFYEKEMEAQLEELKGFEKLILCFQKIVCRFWNSPTDAVLSLILLMLSAILVCQWYMLWEIWYIDFDELKRFSIWLLLPINMYTISEKNTLELAWATIYFIMYVIINYLLIITLKRSSRRG